MLGRVDLGLTEAEVEGMDPALLTRMLRRYDENLRQQDRMARMRTAAIIATLRNLFRGEGQPAISEGDVYDDLAMAEEEEEDPEYLKAEARAHAKRINRSFGVD